MSAEARWSYYTASYIKIEPTESVPLDENFNMPFLKRNIAKDLEDAEESSRAEPAGYEDALEMRICVNSYKILWEPQTGEFFVQDPSVAVGEGHDAAAVERAKERRKTAFVEKVVEHNAWIKSLGQEEIDQLKGKFAATVHDETATEAVREPDAAPQDDSGDRMITDA